MRDFLSDQDWSGIAGTVAGDNTIFVASRDGTPAAALREELTGPLLQGAA